MATPGTPGDNRQVTIALRANSDKASEQDQLGFKPYVTAIAEFLRNEDTEPPLVISIEAEWGSGKTSFMLQLRNVLEGKPDGEGWSIWQKLWHYFHRDFITIWFDPWRYEQEEALWAAFALSFIEQLTRRQVFYRRWWGHLRRFVSRFRWREGWLDLLRKTLAWGLLLYLAIFIGVLALWAGPRWDLWASVLYQWLAQPGLKSLDPLRWGIGVGGVTAYLTLLLAIFNKLRSALEDPLKTDLRKYTETPNYADHIPFLDRFQSDFQSMLNAYAGHQKVAIFIDDLDRCEVPRAADLLSALNLMMTDDRRLIFILGIDSEKVAAGLAVKYERLLPYIYASRTGGETTAAGLKELGGLEFGYEFIKKFIQLQFVLPRPNQEMLDGYLAALSESKTRPESWLRSFINSFTRRPARAQPKQPAVPGPAQAALPRPPGTPLRAPGTSSTGPDSRGLVAPPVSEPPSASIQPADDAENLHRIMQTLSPVCGDNPRWLHVIADLLRLSARLAGEAGLFDQPATPKARPALTLEQLAKIVALRLRWPGVYQDVVANPQLLPALQKVALEGAPQPESGVEALEKEGSAPELEGLEKWRSTTDLMAFLEVGCKNQTGHPGPKCSADWTLASADLAELFQVLEDPEILTGSERSHSITSGRQDSTDFCQIIKTLAPTFESNPRRLKLFTNLLRLHAYIADKTHLFDTDYSAGAYPPPTLEQMGKLIAISLGWPSLFRDIVEEPDLLIALQQVAVGKPPKPAQHLDRWRTRPELMTLLKAGCYDDASGKIEAQHGFDWLLTDLNLDKLLQISPLVRVIARQEPLVPGAARLETAAVPEPTTAVTALSWRVLLVFYNPRVPSEHNRRLSEVMGWRDPETLTAEFIANIKQASQGFANFVVADRIELDDFPMKQDGFSYEADTFVENLRTGSGFHSPDEVDYHRVLRQLGVIEKINSGAIDEVWLQAFPYAGFYESRMVGPDAFFCNAPPLADSTPVKRRFVIMGYNFQRGSGEMLEAFGHRAESILSHVYRSFPPDQNLFRQFTQYDQIAPGHANCGTLHYAPNSTRDYDWGNPTRVASNCDDWLQFPNMRGVTRLVNCDEWGKGDIHEHHMWWLRHLPRAGGATNHVLNNWWPYVLDPNQAL